ncbi:FecR family protein [Sphingobacterium sp. LRF_L2]|uniref:FecR family protein n=1 Tax=Sphingobacterium sp. LRF_L2 TaxID=3369421 RepID=UPI003F600188
MNIPNRLKKAIESLFLSKVNKEDTDLINRWYKEIPEEPLEVDAERGEIKHRLFDKICARKEQKRQIPFARYAVAASVVLAFSLGYWLFNSDRNTVTEQQGPLLSATIAYKNAGTLKMEENTLRPVRGKDEIQSIQVENAQQYAVELEDGTEIWLNAGSTIEKLVFDGTIRKIKLTGEAFFHVAKDSSRPFVIETPQQTVTVLGTQFNLKSYPNQKEVLSLVEGKVRTQIGDQNRELLPGEAIEVERGGITLQPLLENNMLWKEQVFAFEEETLPEILIKVSRWYNVNIDGSNFKGLDHRFTGKIHAKATIQEVLAMLSLVAGRKITFADNLIHVEPQK